MSRTPSKRHASRRRAVMRAARKKKKIDAFLVTCREDVSYLSGFTGEDSALVVTDGWAMLITDGRYEEQGRSECGDIEIQVRTGPTPPAVAEALKGRNIRRLAVQGDHVTLRTADLLRKALKPKKLLALTGVLDDLRCVKDESEIRTIRKAVRAAERAFRELIGRGARSLLRRSERDVAAELDYRMRTLGASAPAFETIVAAGPHSSRPHYRPGSTKIRSNQPLLFDFGAMVDGYCSDLTRTVFIGRIPHELAHVYEVVLRAQNTAIAVISPGTATRTVDAAARKVIEAAGYGKHFLHGLGHGIGKQVHEGPTLGRGSSRRIRKGMVMTIEPGVYLPGLGGVRIEDDVVVTSTGAQRVSSLPRTLGAMCVQ